MKRNIFLAALALLASQAASATDSDAAGVCASCAQQSDFALFAEGLVAGEGAGNYLTHVYNPDTGVIYRVNVIKESEPGGLVVYTNSFRAAAEKETAAAELKGWLQGNEYVMPLPYGQQFPSFTQAGPDHQEICPIIGTAFPAITGVADSVLRRAIQLFLGTEPHIVTIFDNGDVAHYRLVDVRPGSASCQYEPGSAREADGDVIPDGYGSGTVHGNYVTPGVSSGPGHNVFFVRVNYGGIDRYQSCSRIGGGPWSCEVY